MKYCIKCGLPETYPKIKIDAEGVCCFCRFYEAHQAQLDDYDSLHRQFLSEIEKAKEKARENGSPYDCIVGLSGGKDGAYLICQLKKVYGMRVLAYTFDNGFSTDFGRQNCEKLKRAMDIDHIYISMKDSELCKFYRAALKVTRNFCSICFHFMHYHSHLLASRFGIPLIVNGRTRSQIYQNACEMKGLEPFELSRSLKAFEYQMFGRLLDKLDGRSCVDFLPEAEVSSLSYFTYHKVTDEEKMAYLEKEIGWERPKNAKPHADCWAHEAAEKLFLDKNGFPLRTSEMAQMVRSREMDLEEAARILKKDRTLYQSPDPALMEKFYQRVGMKPL